MRVSRTLLGVVLLALFPTLVVADGLVYQLPKDGTWTKFTIQGKLLGSDEQTDDPVLNITGTLTISSVGVVRDGDVAYRWIEIVIDAQRDGKAFKEIDKLLIPEEHIGAGKQPLKHLRDAWYMHSAMDKGEPRRLDDKEKVDIAYRQRVRAILHPPFENAKSTGKVDVTCKLGNVQCDSVTAEVKETHGGSNIEYCSSYTIYLHQDAPFGVAMWQATNRVRRRGELVGAAKLTLTLTDFGTGARSGLPEK